MHVEVDSRKNILSVNTWVRMTWNDDKLKWNSKDYAGIEEMSVGIHEVWQPDLYLYNSALHGIENYESRHCIVRQDGEVTWIAPTVFHSFCDFNLVLWPFETNTCELTIGSWNHNGDEINIKLQDKGFDLQYYSAGEWRVQNVSAHRQIKMYSCCPEPYYMLEYKIKLTRSSELYYHVIFVVSIPIVFLVLITFWLNPESEMKLIINICAIITDILILLYLGQKVPARVNNLPLIVRFFSGCLCQITLSTVISCFIIHISVNAYNISIPRTIRNLLYGKLRRILGLNGIIREIESQKFAELQEVPETEPTSFPSRNLSTSNMEDDDQECIISQSRNVKRLELILLVTAIDRISFLLFCFTFTIIAIAYIRINSDAFTKNLHLLYSSPSQTENSTSPNYY
ncbi:neuronal acetylcholine receptor subunit alpha-3-like isoform X2 [Phymastichus coffea]|nr:neuronal acetylcholine receptor subunit alpha-3-like isoform X2 [Phymastichus coffea]